MPRFHPVSYGRKSKAAKNRRFFFLIIPTPVTDAAAETARIRTAALIGVAATRRSCRITAPSVITAPSHNDVSATVPTKPLFGTAEKRLPKTALTAVRIETRRTAAGGTCGKLVAATRTKPITHSRFRPSLVFEEKPHTLSYVEETKKVKKRPRLRSRYSPFFTY